MRLLSRRYSTLDATVGRDGILIDSNKPWVAVETVSGRESDRWLPENALVLEQFHEKLFGMYDRFDFERIRRRCKAQSIEGDLDDETLALSCLDLASADQGGGVEESPGGLTPGTDCTPPARRIRPLRSLRLLDFLADRFGCQVRPGKGSEISVYREGGRIFTLGHHGRNGEVHSLVVKRLFKRLGIDPGDWLRAVYG